MFGLEESLPAKKSLKIFKSNNLNKVIELGAGLERYIKFKQRNIKNIKTKWFKYFHS